MQTAILYLFTRTSLHVGAGASVGAIDQPIQRERHTGFPIIPGSALKGSFADQWSSGLLDEEPDQQGRIKRTRVTRAGAISEAAWLFGSDNDKPSFAGSLLFSEARVLAFPIRSARGSYAWITCPLLLQRAARDGVISHTLIPSEPNDDKAIFKTGNDSRLALQGNQIVLEEYCFTSTGDYPANLAEALSKLVQDELLQSIADRLVILSNGIMSHFVNTACEIAQHVRINDETGTAEEGGLFNQENVPADTLFYSVLQATKSRVPVNVHKDKPASAAVEAFKTKVGTENVFQFGGDASTGLGFCSVTLQETKEA